jgi:hypothetical protein
MSSIDLKNHISEEIYEAKNTGYMLQRTDEAFLFFLFCK